MKINQILILVLSTILVSCFQFEEFEVVTEKAGAKVNTIGVVPTVTELIDPSPFAEDGGYLPSGYVETSYLDSGEGYRLGGYFNGYGKQMMQTCGSSKHILVGDPYDDTNGTNLGALHLYHGETGELINSVYGGDVGVGFDASTELGHLERLSITELKSGNIVLANSNDSSGSLNNSGLVFALDCSSGELLGTPQYGERSWERFGQSVIAVESGNFIVASPYRRNPDGDISAGMVVMFNGETGAQVGLAAYGDDSYDYFGQKIIALSGGGFVVGASNHDVGSASNAGSVFIYDSFGSLINQINGNNANDGFGNNLLALSNGNFVSSQIFDDTAGGGSNSGSFYLINGSTGSVIASFEGDNPDDRYGQSLIEVSGSNFVVGSYTDDNVGGTNAGSIMLINGETGVQIGSSINGGHSNAEIGRNFKLLSNGNIVAFSYFAHSSSSSDTGSVMLIDGLTGAQLGSTIYGDHATARIAKDIKELSNGNVVAYNNRSYSSSADYGSGSYLIFDGDTGIQVGSTAYGTAYNQLLASEIFTFSNGNFIVVSEGENNGGVTEAGSFRLIDGALGSQIGATFYGSKDYGFILEYSSAYDFKELSNGNFVFYQGHIDNGANEVGAITLFNGVDASVINSYQGSKSGDLRGIYDYYNGKFRYDLFKSTTSRGEIIIPQPFYDGSNGSNSGAILLMNPDTGAVSVASEGENPYDMYGINFLLMDSGYGVIGELGYDGGAGSRQGRISVIEPF